MKQINAFVDSVYANVDGDKEEIRELKQEMKSHLVEAVYDWKSKGKSEEEAIQMAMDNFGDKKQMVKGLSEFFNVHKKFTRNILIVSLISMALGVFFLLHTFFEIKDFREEKAIIMNEVLGVVESSSDTISNDQKEQLLTVYGEHSDHLKHLAVFNVNESDQFQRWLSNNDYIKDEPATIFPIEYQEASVTIEDNRIVSNKESIISSNFDLGTVAMANDSWIVQYEYNESYFPTVEKNNLLVLGDYMGVFLLPILFFVVFGVLIIIWGFLKKYHKKYWKEIIG
jgi:hypothetical protein